MTKRFLVLAVVLAACGTSKSGSSSSSGSTTTGGSTTGTGSTSGSSSTGSSSGSTGAVTQHWTSATQLSGEVDIAAGQVVEIDPGAQLSVAAGTHIVVSGTLQASSASGTHALLGGTGWTGISVASGGSIALDGVDIQGASLALDVQSGASASYDDGTITADEPFKIGTGATLATDHATMTSTSDAEVFGTLTATYLNYSKGQTDGITAVNASAIISIEDSTLQGVGQAGDMVVSEAAQRVHVAYSTISQVHCAFHFDGVDRYDIDHVTANGNAYGGMLYNPETGPDSITASNFTDGIVFRQTEANVVLTIDSSYLSGTTEYTSTLVQVTNPASAPVPDAGPR